MTEATRVSTTLEGIDFDLITFSNFLTTRDHVTQFQDELRNCAQFLRNNGILLVVGATGASAKYREVYDAISDLILGRSYGSRKFIAWCERIELKPNILSHRWSDAYGHQLKKNLRSIYKFLQTQHAGSIPAQAASAIEQSIQATYDKSNEWQFLVFKKHARPRHPTRST